MIIARGTDTTIGRLPLAGVRILDLTDEATVLAPRLLADLGAEVIRVEDARGDRIRRRGPFLDGSAGLERSLAHLLYNGGKQSVALALETTTAWELVDRLASSMRVIIAPLEKSEPARRFFEHARLATAHPGVGVVDTVLRRDAPDAAVADLIGVAAGGLLYLNGFADDPPNVPAGRLAYKQASLAAALSAMTLIMAGQRGGKGGRISVSMQEAVMLTTLQTANENYWHWHRIRPGRSGLAAIGGRSIFQTADGQWVSFSIPPPYWDAYTGWLAEITSRDEFRSDLWRDRDYQADHREDIAEATTLLCAALSRDHLVEEGQRRHLLVLPVNDVASVAADPHLNARGFFSPVWHPQFERRLTMPSPPFLASAYEARPKLAPIVGQHTECVLRDIAGLTSDQIAALIQNGTAVSAHATAERVND